MSTLRVVLDPMLSPGGRYTEELTRALIAAAPDGSEVAGLVAASPDEDYERISASLPGLVELHKSVLAERELRAAWHRGLTTSGSGIVHATDLLAPLVRHDRAASPGTQTVATIRDARAWTDPDAVADAHWQRAMGRRAERHADAVVVPTHAVADALAEVLSLGDRVRVIAAAPIADPLPDDAAERAERLGLPERFVVVEDLPAAAIAAVGDALPAVVLSLEPVPDGEREAGAPIRIDAADSADVAVVLGRATVFAAPALRDGLGMGVLQALHLGAPIVYADSPGIAELVADAGIAALPNELPDAVRSVAEEPAVRERLGVQGRDRAGVFSWRDSAEKVWQLHADL